MATNITQTPADRIDFTATGDVTAGTPVVIKSGADGQIGIPIISGVSGDVIPLQVKNAVAELTAKTADTVVVGDKLYWDAANSYLTVTATSNPYVGRATTAKTGAVAGTVKVSLGQP